MLQRLLRLVLPCLLVLALHAAAVACPMCKEALDQNDPARQGVVKGYFFSILFMMAMPYLTLAGIISYFGYLVHKARLRNAELATEPHAQSAAVCGR